MDKSKLTKQEKKAIRLYKTNSTRDAAKKAGIEYQRLRVLITTLAIHRENFYWTEEQDDFIKENYLKMKTTEIAKKLKKTKWAVYHRMKKIKKEITNGN